MLICKVQGKCVSTIKDKSMVGKSLVTVQKLNKAGAVSGELMVVLDTIGCSIGEVVLVASGSAARITLSNPQAPVDAAIIGIVDSCDYNK